MGFLREYLDTSLTVSAEDSAADISKGEIERLQQLHAVMAAAAAHPRRLGADAMPEELAADKKRARRVLHAVEQALKGWGAEPAPWEEASKVAATLNWDAWWEEHSRRLRARRRYVATWCHRYGGSNGDLRWCKSAIVRLSNELKWIEYALR